ncbi:MAG: hypothetical protein AB1499_17455, partial [Nitrospirota bacterium]
MANIILCISLFSTASTILFDLLSMLQPDHMGELKRIVFISEAVMVTSWLFFSISFARSDYWLTAGRLSKYLLWLSPIILIYAVVVPMDAFFSSIGFENEKVLSIGNAGYFFKLALLS